MYYDAEPRYNAGHIDSNFTPMDVVKIEQEIQDILHEEQKQEAKTKYYQLEVSKFKKKFLQ